MTYLIVTQILVIGLPIAVYVGYLPKARARSLRKIKKAFSAYKKARELSRLSVNLNKAITDWTYIKAALGPDEFLYYQAQVDDWSRGRGFDWKYDHPGFGADNAGGEHHEV